MAGKEGQGTAGGPGTLDKPKAVKAPAVGEAVVYVDRDGKAHGALCIHAWTGGGAPVAPSINVVLVSDDPAADDSYGRQVARETSVPHKSSQAAPGWYWCWPAEVAGK